MKNIKISLFCVTIITTLTFGMDEDPKSTIDNLKEALNIHQQFAIKEHIDNQLRDCRKQDEERQSRQEARSIIYHENQTKMALAKVELRKVESEIDFRKCLINYKDSSDIAVSGIPKVCESYALTLQLLGCDAKVDEMIVGFKKIMQAKPKK